MAFIFELSKENLALGEAEALAATGARKLFLKENLLIADVIQEQSFPRLAYTKAVYLLLFRCYAPSLSKKLLSFDWQAHYKKSFCVRTHAMGSRLTVAEQELASIIWRRLAHPKVNLESPETQFDFFFIGREVICAKLIYTQDSTWQLRKPHLKPGFLPTSLSPRLARAMVNLTGIEKGTITDPFCGSGGILVEVGLMGFPVVGYDIDEQAIAAAKENMRHFRIVHATIQKKDACTIKKGAYVVSDLPYGRSTKLSDEMESLYLSFFRTLKKVGFRVAVLGLPSAVPYKRLLKKAGLKIRQEFSQYLHKSLTKQILVIRT